MHGYAENRDIEKSRRYILNQMKRIILLLFFVVSVSNIISSQTLTGNCQQTEKIKKIGKACDSLTRFLFDIKNTSLDTVWSKFLEDAQTDSVDAFNNFGERSVILKDSFELLGAGLDRYTQQLITAIDQEESLTGQQINDSIVSLIRCYYADTTENSLEILVSEYGWGPFPQVFASGGSCEIALRSCLSDAMGTFTSQLIACGFGGAGLIKYLGGWWGGGAGFLCFLISSSSYNQIKYNCFMNYAECLGN